MDGSGKSTVANTIKDRLEAEGRSVLIITHPNRETRIGRLQAAFLLKEGKPALLMSIVLYVMDVLHSLTVMKRNKGGYDDVIFVRYSMAVAYLPDDLCKKAYNMICHILPYPDSRIFVDVDPEVAMKRILARGEELEVFETVEKLDKVRRRMLSISEDWTIVDNSRGLDDLMTGVDEIFRSMTK